MSFEDFVKGRKPLPQYTGEQIKRMTDRRDEENKARKQDMEEADNALLRGMAKNNPLGLYKVLGNRNPELGPIPKFDGKTGQLRPLSEVVSKWHDQAIGTISRDDKEHARKVDYIEKKFAAMRKELDL